MEGANSRDAFHLMLEEGMLGRHLALADVERLSGVSRSFRRWHDSGRQLQFELEHSPFHVIEKQDLH
jgi:hypothetical protein